MHVRESKARDFEDIWTKNFRVICARKIRGRNMYRNGKNEGFGKGNAARGEDRGVMFGARWKKLRDSTMLSSGQSKSLALEKSAKLGNIFSFRLVRVNLIIIPLCIDLIHSFKNFQSQQ